MLLDLIIIESSRVGRGGGTRARALAYDRVQFVNLVERAGVLRR